MASNVIREFLVALGFKVDEAGLKKFEGGVKSATKAVFGLAAAIEGTAVLIAAGISRFASNLETLYFAAQRVGSSVTTLKAFDRAAQDFGTTAGEAQASVEGLAHALRVNPPGTEGLLASFGVQLKRTKTGAVDTVNAMLQLSAVFRKQPIYMAEQYASLLGIDEKTLLAMRDPNFAEQYRKVLDLMRGSDWDKAARDAHEFENNVRDLWTLIESVGAEVGDSLAQKFGFKDFKEFNLWLKAHKHEIAQQISDAILLIVKAALWLGEKIIWLKDKFLDLNRETDGWAGKLLLIAGLLKITGVGSIIFGLAQLGLAASGAVLPLTALTAALTGLYAIYMAASGKSADNWLSDLVTNKAPAFMDKLGALLHGGGQIHRGIRNNNPGNLLFAGQAGAWNDEGYAHFADPQTGLAAMARQLALYAKRGLASISAIIGEYDKGEPDKIPGYRADVTQRTGYGADQRLNLRDPQVMANLMNAMVRHENAGDNPYPGDWFSSAAQQGIAKVSVTNNITVSGAGDPKAVANKVVDAAQEHTYSALSRAFAPAHQ